MPVPVPPSVRRVLAAAPSLAVALALGAALVAVPRAQPATGEAPALRVEVSYPDGLVEGPITGRVFFMLSRTADPEPRFQTGRTGVPFFGRDVERLPPGQAAVIDASDLGSPVASLADIPAGDYYVQALINVYSEFRRADGHVVWMHDDRWEGQNWRRSPGNLYSEVSRVRIDPGAGGIIRLTADRVIPPVEIPADTAWVRRIKFQSPMLTRFWGRPIFLGATVLLPRDYDTSALRYPVLYVQGHFSLNPPFGFTEGGALHLEWVKDDFPRMIVVTLQHPNPYFDDSYGVNSPNVGPYGDALMEELLPEVETRFRVIREPWARLLAGGSTGGWIALAHQVLYPDFYGGVWSYCPDPVTFSDVEGINIYEDTNAFYKQHEWRRVVTPNTRETDGRIRLTSEQRNHYELVSGTRGRSGEQLDIWSAVFGPVGPDGYFQPLFDKRDGTLDPEVADYWREHYDLLHHLRRHWPALGPKLLGKIRVYTGDMDNFYLNNSTRALEAWMKTTTDPQYPAYFEYGDGAGHCYSGTATPAQRLREMAEHVRRHAPPGADRSWWSDGPAARVPR
jgi:hypothetical protein